MKQMSPHGLRNIFFILVCVRHGIVYAQRYTGYGRGMSNDSYSFGSPTLKEAITSLLIATISFIVAGLLCKINENKEGKLSNFITLLTFLFGLAGVGAALPLVYNYWYILVIIAIGLALYGAFKNK